MVHRSGLSKPAGEITPDSSINVQPRGATADDTDRCHLAP